MIRAFLQKNLAPSKKLSTKLVKENDVIVVENLNLKAMAQCLKLGKSVNDFYKDCCILLQHQLFQNQE
jgi:transposase